MSGVQTEEKIQWCDDARNILNKQIQQVVTTSMDLKELAILANKSEDYAKDVHQRTKYLIGKMEVGDELGKGNFGRVVRLQGKKDSGQMPLAFKELTSTSHDKMTKMKMEADVYARIGPHPNVVGCYGIMEVGGKQWDGHAVGGRWRTEGHFC